MVLRGEKGGGQEGQRRLASDLTPKDPNTASVCYRGCRGAACPYSAPPKRQVLVLAKLRGCQGAWRTADQGKARHLAQEPRSQQVNVGLPSAPCPTSAEGKWGAGTAQRGQTCSPPRFQGRWAWGEIQVQQGSGGDEGGGRAVGGSAPI